MTPQELVGKIEDAQKSKQFDLLIKLCQIYFDNWGKHESILMLWAHAKMNLKKFDESIPAIMELVKKFPQNLEYKFNYAFMLQCKGDIDLAASLYKEILECDNKHNGATVNYANIISGQGNMCAAIKILSNLTSSGGAPAEAYNNIGSFLKNIGENEQAINAYNIAILKDPKYIEAYYNLCMAASYSGMPSEDVYSIHKLVGGMIEAGANFQEPTISDPDKKILKIGYMSADFRKHAVANFLLPVLTHHDKNKVQIHCYSCYTAEDEVTYLIQKLSDNWTDITKLSDIEAANKILNDGIDILIDLSGYTANTRVSIFAFKPAPVRVTWLGYVATTGMKAMDWRLVDEYTEPSGDNEKYNIEKLYRLPNTFSVYLPPAESPDIGELPFLRNSYVTFCSFNYFGKVNDDVINHWAGVLLSVNNSKLILKANSLSEPIMQEKIKNKFSKLGVDASRLIFYGKTSSYEEHMNLYNEVDIALDTFPYSGATTTCEALWMGVPVIVKATSRMRIGVSMANNTGFGNLVANTKEEFVNIAASLAGDTERLRELRLNMRQRLVNTPLFDAAKFTIDLENAFKDMYKTKYELQRQNPQKEKNNKFLEITEIYSEAVCLYENKNILEAESLFRKIVAFSAEHVESYIYLGMISDLRLNLTLSIGYFEKATFLDNKNHLAFHKLGIALHKMGRNREAIQSLLNAVTLAPENSEYLCDLGVVYEKNKEIVNAETCFRKSLSSDQNNFFAWYNFGNLLSNNLKHVEAKHCFENALAINPNNLNAINNLALVELNIGNYHSSIALLKKAILIEPGNVSYINNLATVLSLSGNDVEGLRLLLPALQNNENNIEIIITAANIFQKLGKLNEAKRIYEKGILINSNDERILTNLGNCYKLLGLYSDSLILLKKAIDLNPNNFDAHVNIANLYKDMGDSDFALLHYSKASNLNKNFSKAHSGLCMSYLYSKFNSSKVFEIHKEISFLIESSVNPIVHNRKLDKSKLKIGYVSGDLRNHAVSFFLKPLISRHDKDKVEIYLYSNTQQLDSVSLEYSKMADHWIDIRSINDVQLSEMINTSGIDILVDLSGHTSDNRLQVFAYKPAPIQVSWLGYLFSTGLSRIDWRLVDQFTEIGSAGFNSEKRYYLPDTYCVYEPPIDSPDVSELPFLNNGYITFGSFNSLAKLNHKVVELWSSIMLIVPNSKIIIKSAGLGEESIDNLLLNKFKEFGIHSNRVILISKTNSTYDHLEHYSNIDICLDTYPYPGVTTTCEALWMGVPVITIQNDRMSAGVSLLSNAGLSDFIAYNIKEFLEITVSLCNNKDLLIFLRSSLRSSLTKSKLLDYDSFVNSMEKAFNEMVDVYNKTLD